MKKTKGEGDNHEGDDGRRTKWTKDEGLQTKETKEKGRQTKKTKDEKGDYIGNER